MKIDKSGSITLLVLVLILLLVAMTAWWSIQHLQTKKLLQSDAGSALSDEGGTQYTDFSGNELSLDLYLGKILIVYSWASWCPQCKDDLKILEQFANESNDKEVAVLAINRGEHAATAERFLNTTIGTSPKLQLVLDPDDRFFHQLDGYAMPETIIFNPDGSEYRRIRTTLSIDELKAVLDNISVE